MMELPKLLPWFATSRTDEARVCLEACVCRVRFVCGTRVCSLDCDSEGCSWKHGALACSIAVSHCWCLKLKLA
jgi:hypothetical protein